MEYTFFHVYLGVVNIPMRRAVPLFIQDPCSRFGLSRHTTDSVLHISFSIGTLTNEATDSGVMVYIATTFHRPQTYRLRRNPPLLPHLPVQHPQAHPADSKIHLRAYTV